MSTPDTDITGLLGRWKTGDRSVEDDLISAVYPVMRELASAQVRQNRGSLTLRATELANEAYAKLARLQGLDWQDRDHFYAIAANIIRRVVVDHVRERGRIKRGGGLPLMSLDEVSEAHTPTLDDSVDWLAVDEALTDLAVRDSDCARVVELKFFVGLTNERIADVCGTSPATVVRQWRFARAWLGRRLGAV